jgi:hypothetical protein
MIEDDRSYYQRRAEAEIERAQEAILPQAVRAHYQLAEAYLERVATAPAVRTEAL